jgi:ABC-type nitrate/sulfonate/bicarbonate transport system permease component
MTSESAAVPEHIRPQSAVPEVGGRGNLLLTANSQLDGPLAWAALVWLSVLGILLFAAVVAVEKLTIPWAGPGQH